jgi:hypothetical protein
MIKPLRKKHLQLWIVLAVVIPIGIIAAVVTRREPAKGKLLQADASSASTVLFKSVDKEGYTVSLRGNADTSTLQLEWINKGTITFPSALIYQLRFTDEHFTRADTFLIGRIEAKGTYHFGLQRMSPKDVHIVLYDVIHHSIIDSLNFK